MIWYVLTALISFYVGYKVALIVATNIWCKLLYEYLIFTHGNLEEAKKHYIKFSYQVRRETAVAKAMLRNKLFKYKA